MLELRFVKPERVREDEACGPGVTAAALVVEDFDPLLVSEACLEAVSSGTRTADLSGHASTSEFTDEVIARIRSKLEVWATLGDG